MDANAGATKRCLVLASFPRSFTFLMSPCPLVLDKDQAAGIRINAGVRVTAGVAGEVERRVLILRPCGTTRSRDAAVDARPAI